MDTLSAQHPDPEKRSVGRLLRTSLIVAVALAALLLVVLATVTANTRAFEGLYALLFWLTVGVAVGLFALVLEMLRRLVRRYRKGIFGTRLMARMAASFTLMTIVPVLLIYLVAVAFVGRSIEFWFDVPLERALESGVNLGRAALDAIRIETTAKARSMALELADTRPSSWPQLLNRLRDQNTVQEAVILTGVGRIITTSGGQLASLVPDMPSSDLIRRVRVTRLVAEFEPGDPKRREPILKLRLLVTIGAEGGRPDDSRYLQLIHYVPEALADSSEAVAKGRTDYQQLQESKSGLKRLFRVTLTLIFFLTAFAAIAAAFLLSGWLTGPLSMLAAGTRAVAGGDFRPVKDYSGRDELGVLTQSFNAMTRQLEDARSQVERNQHELEQVNARLQSVLANLTAGVLVLDSAFRLTLANAGAERILGLNLIEHLDEPIAAVPRLGPLAAQVRDAFAEQTAAGASSWQRQFTLADGAGDAGGRSIGPEGEQTILARGSVLPERRVGYVIVFDDITGVISAQRAVAWAEVARRLAHEIKNPLTPIQLSAERMRMKLAPVLGGGDAELLEKSTRTIINQVSALKLMVDEFREYARLPTARLAPLDLNALIEEVLHLYAASEAGRSLRTRLDRRLPPLMGDRTQLRQLIHNLVKNAVEATERASEKAADPASEHGAERGAAPLERRIDIATELVRTSRGNPAVRLVVRDNGPGFPPGVHARMFEPYVTTKVRGTGLGLAIVKKIVDEHGARIDAGNVNDRDGHGAQVAVLFTNLAKNGENKEFDEPEFRQA